MLVFSLAAATAHDARLRGVAWKLGDGEGDCLGAIVWLDGGHVCRVLGVNECHVQLGCPEAAPWHRVVARGRSRSRSPAPPSRVPRGSPLGRAPKRRAAQASAGVRDTVDAQVLAGMSFKDLETLASKLRKEGEQGVPSSRGREDGKRARMDVEAYRAALAAHLNIDLQGLQAVGRVGAAARSDAHAKAMLDRIDEHLDIYEELPKQKAADDNERELAK